MELAVDDGYHSEEEPVAASSESSPALMQTDRAGHINSEAISLNELQDALRSEAYHWPRLVFPPLKKSGHIIMDGCTAEGLSMVIVLQTFH